MYKAFFVSAGKEFACNTGDLGSIPGLGRSSRERKDYPLQYSGLGNSMVCIVHRVAKSWIQLSGFHFNFHMYSHIFFNHHLKMFLLRQTFPLCCLLKCSKFWHMWFCHISSINSHPPKMKCLSPKEKTEFWDAVRFFFLPVIDF